jgi:hypothetical protein
MAMLHPSVDAVDDRRKRSRKRALIYWQQKASWPLLLEALVLKWIRPAPVFCGCAPMDRRPTLCLVFFDVTPLWDFKTVGAPPLRGFHKGANARVRASNEIFGSTHEHPATLQVRLFLNDLLDGASSERRNLLTTAITY